MTEMKAWATIATGVVSVWLQMGGVLIHTQRQLYFPQVYWKLSWVIVMQRRRQKYLKYQLHLIGSLSNKLHLPALCCLSEMKTWRNWNRQLFLRLQKETQSGVQRSGQIGDEREITLVSNRSQILLIWKSHNFSNGCVTSLWKWGKRMEDHTHLTPFTTLCVACWGSYESMESCMEADFFRDQVFTDFRNALDSEMKRLKSAGLGSHVRKAEPFMPEEEKNLWDKGILPLLVLCWTRGSSKMESILRLEVALNTASYATMTAKFKWLSDLGKDLICCIPRTFLNLNNQSGLKGKKTGSKEVTQHGNEQTPYRCQHSSPYKTVALSQST